jgi:osmotically inducible protein OsmC
MASIKRHASAAWQGSGKDGNGSLTTQSATLKDTPYSFNARFGDGKGTNPEELIAAAHAGCFSMALSNELGSAGFTPESIRTSAVVTIDKTAAGFAITSVHLDVTAKVPGASQQAFEAAASAAKSGCPVSKVLKAEITMDARLET